MRSPVKIWRERKERYRWLGQEGKVMSMTKIHESVAGFSKQPFWVVMVKIGRFKTVGQLVAGAEPKIGDRVTGVLRRLRSSKPKEVIVYGVKWKKL